MCSSLGTGGAWLGAKSAVLSCAVAGPGTGEGGGVHGCLGYVTVRIIKL
jgi:hypothetical protein